MPSSAPDSGGESPGETFAYERRVAVAAAQEAGGMLRGRFGEAFRVRTKGEDGDVVTDLDLAAEKLVLTRLQHHFPHDRVLSEEAGPLGAEGRRTWLVDPLDGSNNVAIGLPVFVVGIGLCVGQTPVVGVVHEPVTGHTWHTVAGQGAQGPQGPLTGPDGGVPRSGPVVAWTQGHAVGRGDATAAACAGRWSGGAGAYCSCGRRCWAGPCWRAARSTGSSATGPREWTCRPGRCSRPRRVWSCTR